jgi:serine/threonine protein kinase
MIEPGNSLQEKRYFITDKLKSGGMGSVYKAIDLRVKSFVAIKEIKEEFIKDEKLHDAFEREANLLSNLSHEALPKVTDFFSEKNSLFLVMEFIDGFDFEELLKKGESFSVADVINWSDKLLDALEEMHSNSPPVIHRDIKPSNIKLTSRKKIKLIDFGLAKGAIGLMSLSKADESVPGFTNGYASLEQVVRWGVKNNQPWIDLLTNLKAQEIQRIKSEGADACDDIYSLGATIYCLLTSKQPADALVRAFAVWSGKPDPMQFTDVLPAPIASVLSRSMAISRSARYQNAREMRKALKAIINGSPETTTIIHVDPDPIDSEIPTLPIPAPVPQPPPTKFSEEATAIRIDIEGLMAEAAYANSLSTSSDGVWLASGHANRTVHLWAVKDFSQHIIIKPKNSDEYLTSCGVRNDKDSLDVIIGIRNGYERWYLAANAKPKLAGWTPYNNLVHTQFSTDGSLILIVSWHGNLDILRSDNSELVATFDCKENLRRGVFCGNDFVLAGSESGRTFLWEIANRKLIKTNDDHQGSPISAVEGLTSSNLYMSAGEDGTLVIRKMDSPSILKTLTLEQPILTAAWDKRANSIFTGLGNNTLHAFDMLFYNRKWRTTLPDQSAALAVMDGGILAVANYDRAIEIRSTRDGHRLAELVSFGAEGWIVFSSENQFIGEGIERFSGSGAKMMIPAQGQMTL